MRWLMATLATVAILAAVATAENPSGFQIEGKVEYDPHDLVKLRAVGADEKAGYLWDVYPFGKIQRATTSPDLLEFSAHPGVYDVVVRAISVGEKGGFDIREARTTVTIKSCHPPTPPDPPKPQPPQPAPPGKGGTLDPENAIGRIAFGNAGCSATVIHPRRSDGRWDILTAAHCIGSVGQVGTITMPKTNKRYTVKVVKFDRTCDLCWLVTSEPIDDIEYAHLSKTVPAVGSGVWHRGYGVDRPRNKEVGTLSAHANSQGQLRFDLSVSSGDSGGGIFRADTNEVISSVCCTMGKGVKTAMWGGSCEIAWKMRPSNAEADVPELPSGEQPSVWFPLEIPEVQSHGRALSDPPTLLEVSNR